MLHNTPLIFVFLLSIETAVLWAAGHPRSKKFFRFIPAVFWIYFLPMVASSFNMIDRQSPLYGWTTAYGLPASLFLLLVGVDLQAIARLGRTAVLIFLAGSVGIMAGTVIAFALFRPLTGDHFFSGFGALSASWIGGSANMIAVKEAVGTPDHVFLPMVVVDTVVPYAWMGFLIFASTWQRPIDRWNRADEALLEHIRRRLVTYSLDRQKQRIDVIKTVLITLAAFIVSLGLKQVSSALPVVLGVISAFTWTVILVSVFGLACSLTRLRQFEPEGSTKVGYFLLYFVLTTIGAKASITHLGESLILIAAGFMIVLVHAAVLMAAARYFKAPVMLAAAASQANIGGVASAPVVAEVYQTGLSTIGLLMAVLGNIIGTYLGIIVSQVCRAITLM